MTRVANGISVVVVAYESGPALMRCLDSIRASGGAAEIVVVDNGAAGSEVDEAAATALVEVVSPGRNVGFGAGCNLGAARAGGEILVFLNPDTVVEEGALEALARALEDDGLGIVMPRLRLLAEPGKLNSAGNTLHVAGFGWAGRYGEPVETVGEVVDVAYASGAALALRAEAFRELGGFTDELFLYQEDLELSWRAHLYGLRVVIEPRADVLHDYVYDRNELKRYYLERNRLVFILTAYSGRLLALLLPVLLCAELAVAALAAREGWFREKAAGWRWCLAHAGWLARHRRETQALRRVPDRELARFLTAVIAPAMIPVSPAARAANPLVSAWWSLVRRLL